jgi:geranylgeranyl diphosphate synthase type I
MLHLKTGALLEFCAVAGAIIALDTTLPRTQDVRGRLRGILDDGRISAFANFAAKAGTAFQLRDDWLGVFGDEEALGKPICSDVAEGKPTILLLETLAGLDGEELARFKSFIGKKTLSGDDVRDIRALSELSGAGERVDARARTLLEEAKEALAPIPSSECKELLFSWADFLVDRNL